MVPLPADKTTTKNFALAVGAWARLVREGRERWRARASIRRRALHSLRSPSGIVNSFSSLASTVSRSTCSQLNTQTGAAVGSGQSVEVGWAARRPWRCPRRQAPPTARGCGRRLQQQLPQATPGARLLALAPRAAAAAARRLRGGRGLRLGPRGLALGPRRLLLSSGALHRRLLPGLGRRLLLGRRRLLGGAGGLGLGCWAGEERVAVSGSRRAAAAHQPLPLQRDAHQHVGMPGSGPGAWGGLKSRVAAAAPDKYLRAPRGPSPRAPRPPWPRGQELAPGRPPWRC